MTSSAITRASQTNFAWAFFGLSKSQRFALCALYAFCRTVDDIVDEAKEPRSAKIDLDRWRGIVDRLNHPSVFDPAVAWDMSKAVSNFPIRKEDLHWIIDGVETDLHQQTYPTFESLLSYCDAVASAVGLASMAIFGGERNATAAYAVATGRALQLTNILRDVGADAAMDRIYIPQEDLAHFGYSSRDLHHSRHTDKFVALMKFESERARSFYVAAEDALPESQRRLYPAAEVMRKIYRTLLIRLEAKQFQVFGNRIRVSKPKKAAIAMSIWLPHLFRRSAA